MHRQTLMLRYTTPTPHRDPAHGRLLEEIAWLEARLLSIGHTGDCAYEKKLARSYQELLQARRHALVGSHLQASTVKHGFLRTCARYLFSAGPDS